MRHIRTFAVAIAALTLASGCSTNDDYVAKLTDATAEADVSLREAIEIAEADASSSAVNASLQVADKPEFVVRAVATDDALEIKLDLSGAIVTRDSIAERSGPCADSISLAEALAVAEHEANGEAVAAVPDDDVACAFEIQVLQPDNLWEVKVNKSGEVLESEDSDENGTPDSD